ncbi:hypothetical protein ACWY4P_41110 [Streptomyces sp. LZ34]
MSDDEPDNVIHLFQTPRKGATPQGQPHDERDERIVDAIATWQALYMHHGETLTNPTTAASLRIAMEMVGRVLDSARDAGAISEEQHDKLHALVWIANAAADKFQP